MNKSSGLMASKYSSEGGGGMLKGLVLFINMIFDSFF